MKNSILMNLIQFAFQPKWWIGVWYVPSNNASNFECAFIICSDQYLISSDFLRLTKKDWWLHATWIYIHKIRKKSGGGAKLIAFHHYVAVFTQDGSNSNPIHAMLCIYQKSFWIKSWPYVPDTAYTKGNYKINAFSKAFISYMLPTAQCSVYYAIFLFLCMDFLKGYSIIYVATM